MNATLPGASAIQLEPLSPEFDRDPYPILRRLREEAPVYWWETAGAWVLTRHDDVTRILSDEQHFSPDQKLWERYVPPPPEHADHPVLRMRDSNLLTYEGAEHTRLRQLASVALTRRAVRNLEPLLRDLIEELLDRVAPRGECDFVDEIAHVYPVTVVSRLLGIPPNSDRERRFKQAADAAVAAFNPMLDEASKLRAIQAMERHMAEVGELMEEKRANPDDDLMTDMIQAEAEGDRFTPEEVIGMVMTILVAGSETTANSMGFGLLQLLTHPEQLVSFRDAPKLRAHAVYEMIRYEMPGRFLNRYVKQDVELRGKPLKKGQLLLVSVASAQRDPAVIDDPDRFDIHRVPFDSSAFGIGRHFCLGAQLARLELEVSLGRIVERLPNLRLHCDPKEIPYRSNPAVRGPASMPIRFDPSR